ncbi:MAG: hypothetical protein MI750_16630, partial [Xanthomonadales bacterium]|nr:hypothetical protein [Xanthomonadales bacterium]
MGQNQLEQHLCPLAMFSSNEKRIRQALTLFYQSISGHLAFNHKAAKALWHWLSSLVVIPSALLTL